MPAGQRLGVLAQEAPDGPESLLETVLAADVERSSLLAEAETASDPHRIGEIHARLVDIEAHRAPARAAAILAGLGFDAEAQARPCRDFSGGWRMRVALAAVLFAAARPAAAGRAHQPSRPRGDPVAGGLPQELSPRDSAGLP